MANEGADVEVITQEQEFKHPLGVSANDGDNDFVLASVVFPGLKKKFMKNEPSNGSVTVKYETRSFNLIVSMKSKDKNKSKEEDKFQYLVKKLPDDIVPEKCYHKVKEDQVVLYLKKEKSRSWDRDLSDTGLETYIDPDE